MSSLSSPSPAADRPPDRVATARALPSRWLRLLIWLLRGAMLGLIALWSGLLLLWLVLHWGILPHIDQWRGPLEDRASALLGIEVRIGAIQVRSSGWVPSLELSQVELFDSQQRSVLLLPRVVAALAPQSLLGWDLRFAQLFIEGAQLDVRRDPRGRILVAGFDVERDSNDSDSDALRWFLKQPELVVRGGSLRWTDELRGAAPLVLTDIMLVMRNALRRHAVQLDATPPAAWGDRFSLRGRFTQPLLDGADFKRWSGTVYAELPRADVRELQQHLTLPFAVSEGDGALRAWVDLRQGVATSATVDLALRAVSLQFAAALQPLVLAQIEGRLVASRKGGRYSIEARQLGLRTGDGVGWPASDIRMAWRETDGGALLGGEFGAERLDLDSLARLAAALPLGEPLRKQLADLRPQGLLRGLAVTFEGAATAPTAYRLSGAVEGLTLAARADRQPDGIGRPGLRNADLSFSANQRGGDASLKISHGELVFPGVFDQPAVALERLTGELQWQIEAAADAAAPPKLTLQVRQLHFANADAQGSAQASWSSGATAASRFPGRLELDGELSQGVASSVARYLPLQIDATVRDYVTRAVRGGALGRTQFRVSGKLDDFPFADQPKAGGEFRIAGRVSGLTLAYMPDGWSGDTAAATDARWPPMTQLDGELVFDRASMTIRDAQARIGTVQLDQVKAGIADLAAAPTLLIDGRARGPAVEMLRFVNATPVGGWIDHSLARATIGGDAELRLALAMPLADEATTTVKGSVTLGGNDLRIQPDTPALANARGRIDFSERGLQIVGATARVFGGDASFEGGTQGDGSLRFSGGGIASAEGLRRASELGALTRLARQLSGQTAYRVNLGFVRGQTELTVTSNLLGMAADLPAPLRKPADVPLALRVQNSLLPDSGSNQPLRDSLRIELGSLLQAQYVREYPRDGDGAPRVLRGGIGVNERAPAPASGVAASLNLVQADGDAWQRLIDRVGEPAAGGGAGAGTGGAAIDVGGYAPQRIALRAQQLTIGERKLNRLVAGLSNDNGNWRANLDAEQLAGYLEYRPAPAGAEATAAGRVYARLSRLSLPKQEAEEVETLLDRQPTSVPALDVIVDEFELRGKRLGRVELEAINRNLGGDAGPREWQLTRLNMITPEARLTASGRWGAGATASAVRRSEIDFRLELADSGRFLERLGSGRAIRGGKGELAGQIGWQGSPISLDFNSLRGQFRVAIEAGQFLKAEPGAARLLSVLSMQSLPRRLSLDFRDVFQKGFAFDSVSGDVGVVQGVARTNNLVMRGAQAAVLMEGAADIERETQDIRVVVVPEINAGTASLAYAAINPAIGLGTFLAQLVLRKPLIQAGTREFQVRGSWDDPKVDRIDRKFSDPLPDLDPAPLPSATPPADAVAPQPTR